jgi:hypothetical protein
MFQAKSQTYYGVLQTIGFTRSAGDIHYSQEYHTGPNYVKISSGTFSIDVEDCALDYRNPSNFGDMQTDVT